MSTDYTAPHILNQRVSMDEVVSRAFAAAAKVLNGDAWGYQRKVDCAADIVARVMELAPRDNCRRCGAPRAYRATLRKVIPGVSIGTGVSRNVPLCLKHARTPGRWLTVESRRPVMADERDTVARRYLSFFRLEGMAKNWRDSELARAAREQQASADATSITLESFPSTSRPTGTPYRAGLAATEILDTLGVEAGGILYNVAYAAAREADGLTSDEIADELGVKAGTLRQHINRAASKVPSAAVHSPRTHSEALAVDLYWDAPRTKDATALPSNFDAQNKRADEAGGWKDVARLKADAKIERTGNGGRRVTGQSRWMSARTNGGTRINPGDTTPNVLARRNLDAYGRPMLMSGGNQPAEPNRADCAAVPVAPITLRTTEPVAPWTGDTCAAWAERLTPATAARLAAKAADQRTRAATLDPMDRDARRAAVGLPPVSA